MKWADYCVTKLSLADNGMIDNVILCKDLGDTLDNEYIERNRNWLVEQVSNGKTFCSIQKNVSGRWYNIGAFSYDGNFFQWYIVPQNLTRRKTFVSYYHNDDQIYRTEFENLFGDLIVSKSVEKDEIDSDNSDGYIKQLIQQEYLTDTTVLVVLIGPKTKCRMHVDWEISGALNYKVGDRYAGLIGILLPTHPDYGKDTYSFSNLPERLAANLKSGYAKLYDWSTDRVKLQNWIEAAFTRREEDEKIINNILQMQENICD